MATPWEVLGIRPGATPAEVRAAYRRRSLLLHPDRLVGAPAAARAQAQAAMAELNAAYDVLRAAARGWAPSDTPPSTALARHRRPNRWERALAVEPARGVLADTAA